MTAGGKLHRKSKADDRNTLLVTGLSSQTAATEIKAVFKRHGKVDRGWYLGKFYNLHYRISSLSLSVDWRR